MDRQAWIAVALCVAGLIGWQFYMASSRAAGCAARRRCRGCASSPTPDAQPRPARRSATAAASRRSRCRASRLQRRAEPIESFRGEDRAAAQRERGAAPNEPRRRHQRGASAESRRRKRASGVVVLNSPDHPPIGAIIEQPLRARCRNSRSRGRQMAACNSNGERRRASSCKSDSRSPPTTEKKDNYRRGNADRFPERRRGAAHERRLLPRARLDGAVARERHDRLHAPRLVREWQGQERRT